MIGVSGGKDSTFQVLTMLNLGLKPLCVCFEPTIPTKVGRKNLKNLNSIGVDIIHIKRDPNVYKNLPKQLLKKLEIMSGKTILGYSLVCHALL